MAVVVLPVDGGSYSADVLDDLFEAIANQGHGAYPAIVRDMLNELEVTGETSPVSVDTGWAIVKGKLVKNTSNVSVNIPTPASNPRIDRIVVQVDFTTTPVSASIVRVAGTEATVPSVPALDQVDGTIWQVPLAQVQVTTGGVVTVTDERRYIGHGTVDGDSLLASIVDDSTIEISNGALQVKDGGITAVKLGSDVAGFIKGMIMPFSGSFGGTGNHFPVDPDTGNPDTRWHLCNGDTENGVATPNLADRFVIAAGATYAVGATGGAATKNLAHTHGAGTYAANAHMHSVNITTSAASPDGLDVQEGAAFDISLASHTHTVSGNTGGTAPAVSGTSASGGSATQDIMPPYYALAYICYVGA